MPCAPTACLSDSATIRHDPSRRHIFSVVASSKMLTAPPFLLGPIHICMSRTCLSRLSRSCSASSRPPSPIRVRRSSSLRSARYVGMGSWCAQGGQRVRGERSVERGAWSVERGAWSVDRPLASLVTFGEGGHRHLFIFVDPSRWYSITKKIHRTRGATFLIENPLAPSPITTHNCHHHTPARVCPGYWPTETRLRG